MNKKFILPSVIMLSLMLVINTSNVFAMDTASNSGTLKIGSPSAKRLEVTTANMDKAKSRATAEIDRRLVSLNKVLERLNGFKHLSSDQRTVLTTNVQEQIDSLTALRAKISADTDVATLKTDIQSIRDSYRIYAFFIPQIHLLVAADTMLEGVAKGNDVASKLQTKITEAQAGGKDVTALQTALSDMQAKLLIDASAQAITVVTTVTPLTPEGYPGNRTILMTAKSALQKGMQDIRMALQDAKTIIKGLRPEKEMKFGTGSARFEKPTGRFATHSATATAAASATNF